MDKIKPAFSENNIPIIFSSDNNYAPYLGVTIKSIIENSSAEYNYDIIILTRDISVLNQNLLKKEENSNISIRFYDISEILKPYEKLFYVKDRFTIETYYRLFATSIFPSYKKILYLDVDVVVLQDIAQLFQIDISNHYTAAARSLSSVYNTFHNVLWDGRKFRDYQMEILKLKNPYDYFQAGVVMFNIEYMLQNDFLQSMLDCVQKITHPVLVDQDILNALCNEKNVLLDTKWNIESAAPKSLIGFIFEDFYNSYQRALKNPGIIHYNGRDKVWKSPDMRLSEYWWKYARKSVFYEEILYKNLKQA